MRLAIVEIDVHVGGGEVRRLGAMADEVNFIEERVPAAQRANDSLVSGRGASGDHADAHLARSVRTQAASPKFDKLEQEGAAEGTSS